VINIHRVRSAKVDGVNIHEGDNAYLSSDAQAAELVLHGIIEPDGKTGDENITVYWYKKAD
jgi:hypothetical protein